MAPAIRVEIVRFCGVGSSAVQDPFWGSPPVIAKFFRPRTRQPSTHDNTHEIPEATKRVLVMP